MSKSKQAEIFANGFLISGLVSAIATINMSAEGTAWKAGKMLAAVGMTVTLLGMALLGFWRIRCEGERERRSESHLCKICGCLSARSHMWKLPDGNVQAGHPVCTHCFNKKASRSPSDPADRF